MITPDKKKVIAMAEDQMEMAFAGGVISADASIVSALKDMSLGDMPLYGD